MSTPDEARGPVPSGRAATLAIIVAALGYFVDIYDLVLFGVIGRKSLLDLGVARVFGPGTPMPEIVTFLRGEGSRTHA